MADFVAKPIVAILTSRMDVREEVLSLLSERLGPTDFVGPWHPFIYTSYYAPEMGEGLQRSIVSFKRLISPHEISKLKSQTKEIEDKFRIDGKRTVNLDPGYVDFHKVVLGSAKGGGHMVAVGDGVFADVLLWFNKGWQPLPWAYPDFKDGTYSDELTKIRAGLKSPLLCKEGWGR